MKRFISLPEEIFIKSAAFPDLTAVICGDECVSFSELDQYSSNLAWQLQESGTGSGSLVGIYLNPSVNLAISILAVLKTGAAYIPLSRAFPKERIRYILQDASVNLVITDDSLSQTLPGNHTQWLIPDWPVVKDHAEKRVPEARIINASDLAYILYTSGSTGNPKGVMIEHRNLSYYIHWFCQWVMPETRVGLPLTSSFIFAAAVTQFYSTLLSLKTLHILDPSLIRQPEKLLEWYATQQGMGLYCVPTLWSEILHYLENGDVMGNNKSAPSCVYLSGEAVTDELMGRSFDLLPDLQLWNLYGPTEATANLTACRLLPGEAANIGKPLYGTRVFIVGDDLNLVKPGDTGELLACGEGIARGYLNLPELTGNKFISARINGDSLMRLYRTGDIVKEDKSGKLIYIGRKDQQVKIRGFRIELSEIEHALLSVPFIRQAIVKVVEDRRNGKRLVAYVVYHENNSRPVNELRKTLMRALADFMVPEVFVTMESLPQLANGKIDRKSLPLPGIQRPDLGYPVVPPSTENEKMMVHIWEEVLGLEGLGTEDNFFDLGGNSLKANAIVLEVNSRTGLAIQIKSIFDCLTPGNLAGHPAFAMENRKRDAARTTVPVQAEEDLNEDQSSDGEPRDILYSGLSENQKALWFLQEAEPGLSAYNIFYSIALKGALDISCLEKALQEITNRHESLKTKFPTAKKQTEEITTVTDCKVLEIFHSGAENLPLSEADALEHVRKIATEPFDLGSGHPFRFILFKLGNNQHLLAFVVHHIVFDGFSFEVFLQELSVSYDHAKSGLKPGRPDSASSYTRFCREEKKYLGGADYSEDREYWQKQLLHVTTFIEIPTDFVRPETFSQEGGQVRRKINSRLRSGIKAQSDKLGTSMYMTCLAAFSILLYRHTGHNDFLIGTPVANRVKKSYLSAIGYFVNTILFRVKIDPTLSFSDWVATVKEAILENLPHSRFPFSHMNEVLKTDRIPGINPFFQIMFAYHENIWDFSTLSGITGSAEEQFSGNSKFDIFTEIFDNHEDAEIVFTFSRRLYQKETIEILLDHFIQLLENICLAPQTRLNDLSLLSTREFNKLIFQWNQTAFSLDPKRTLVDLINLQIEKTPDLPALVSRQEVISYREMGHKTDIITANLRRAGVYRGVPVGIHLENSPAMVMCIIAVFKAGGIYIPLDPYYPEERLRYVIEKTRIRFLVVDQERINRKQELSEQIIPLNDLLDESALLMPAVAEEQNSSTDLAYIMFTSGSTGNPKGVMIRHDSLINFLIWMKMELNVTDGDTFLSTTSINFDISFCELFTPLISGARLVLEKRRELQAPEKVEAILNEMQVNTVQFVPSGLKALCDAGVLKRAGYLKNIISGGEKLSRSLQEQIFLDFDGTLINLYGPTEATVYMACWHCRRNSPLRMVPIGFPVFNAFMYILNENLEPVPIGVTGEIYIGGYVLADGYFEDPDQTTTRFLPDPFRKDEGSKIYRTGDLGRYLFDGAVEFLGRTDHQVKVRGFRIELGEVETIILRFPGIRRVFVNAREQKEEDVRLTAFIVPGPETKIQENELRDFLRLHLPAYMIPGNFIIAPSIPTLPNGKTDFKALMNLRPSVPKIPEFFQHRMNETEALLSGIWKEILDHEAFTLQDNFFEVGGHSLLLVKMKDLIAEKINTEVSIVDLFHYPTLRSLAAFLRKDKPDHSYGDIAKRVEMRNKFIRQQINKRIFPDNNHS
ncbi:MAG: amino acid adenylation domain-containing protein [Bacteroidetes bacterium]|nr:amino acid adenylation domain-containing protein [Bacteroidota bacterium]